MVFYKIILHIKCFFYKIFLKIIYGKKIKFGKNVQFRKRFNLMISKNGQLIIGDNVFFNNDCSINVMNKVIIGDNCLFGENVKIYDHNHKFRNINCLISSQGYSIGKVEVGKNCWICSGVILLKNCDIGNNSVIAANSVINKKVSKDSIVKNNILIQERKIIDE